MFLLWLSNETWTFLPLVSCLSSNLCQSQTISMIATMLCIILRQVHRDRSVHAPSQWETMLQCNVVSHWLGAYTKWSLRYLKLSQQSKKILSNRSGRHSLHHIYSTSNTTWLNIVIPTYTLSLLRKKTEFFNYYIKLLNKPQECWHGVVFSFSIVNISVS